MTLHFGQQIITIHILPNISRSKDNHTMKFGQLIEYKMRNNFFLKIHTKNMAKKLVPDPSLKIKIDYISGSTVLNVIKFAFIELMYIYHIENIRSSLIYLHGFQLHVLLP